MKSSTLIAMTAVVLIAITTLLIINVAPKSYVPTPAESSFPINDISGIAVFHNGVPYTLNFEQQKIALDALGRAVEVKKADYPKVQGPFNFDKIAIYRIKNTEIELTPIQFVDTNLVFSVPSISTAEYFLELSGGGLQEMINTTFDK